MGHRHDRPLTPDAQAFLDGVVAELDRLDAVERAEASCREYAAAMLAAGAADSGW